MGTKQVFNITHYAQSKYFIISEISIQKLTSYKKRFVILSHIPFDKKTKKKQFWILESKPSGLTSD